MKVNRPDPKLKGCVLNRDAHQQAVFSHASGLSLSVEGTFQAQYGAASLIPVDRLNTNTVATVTLGPNHSITKIVVKYLYERKGVYDLYKEGVVVFSQWKFSTSYLVLEKEDDMGSKITAKVVARKFPGIRKVTGYQGFWTALGVAYLEHISLRITENQEFQRFWQSIQSAGISPQAPIFAYLTSLWNAKNTENAGNVVDTWCDDQTFQAEIVKTVKELTVAYAKSHPDHELLAFSENGLSGFETNVKFQPEISDDMTAFASLALSVRIIIHELDPNQYRKAYGGETENEKIPRINLLRQGEVFYILYSEAFLAAEGYKLEIGRVGDRKITAETRERLYYTTKNDQIQLPGAANLEEYQQILAEFGTKAQLIGEIQQIISSVIASLKEKPLPGDLKFFTSQLLNETYQFRALYYQFLSKISTMPSELQDYSGSLQYLRASAVLDDLSVMEMCAKCHLNVGDAQLDCGHYICKGCFQVKVQEVGNFKGYVIDPAGESVDDLICPLLDCKSVEKITGKALQVLLGEQLEWYQHSSENIIGKRKCQRCTQVNLLGLFLQFSICGCRLCAFCEAEMIQSGNFVCLCGNYFSQMSMTALQSMTQNCVSCRKDKSLMTGFTPVRCSDHSICLQCLERILSSPDPRCPQDHRKFAQYEIDTANGKFKRECGLYCGQYIKSSEALKLDCDCHYCENCALLEVKRRVPAGMGCSQCFVCAHPMPKALIDQYTELLKREDFMRFTLQVTVKNLANYQAPTCKICMCPIGKDLLLPLKCGNSFHKECVKAMAEAHTLAVVRTAVACPECKVEIDPNILQNLMDPQMFHKYNLKLIEAKEKMVFCPNCNIGHIAEPAMLQQQAPVGCQNCGYQFCALCTNQWGDKHDIRLCRHQDLQKQIEVLENVMGPGDIVSQCPTCKIPYLKDDHCEHIKCATAGCPDWNFCCSSVRAPVLAHSTHWHRPDCRYVGTEDISQEPMKANCPMCQILGRRCDPPKQLRKPRRFDFDEE